MTPSELHHIIQGMKLRKELWKRGTMEFTRMITKPVRLGEDWTEGCGGKKTSSCVNYNQALNTLAMNDLRVVLYDDGGFDVLRQ